MVEKKIANATGGKAARACDSCLQKLARWYCAADDAFLCHGCDVIVHSANQLAGRHERVRLETGWHITEDVFGPAWHRGFTRKARTPRHNNKHVSEKEGVQKKFLNPLPFVPEIVNEEKESPDENEAELLYRVPIFDPFAAELCNEVGIEISEERTKSAMKIEGRKIVDDYNDCVNEGICELDDVDLADFSADVESLLGRGFDEDSCDIKELGLLDCKEEDVASMDGCFGGRIVKVKDEEEMEMDMEGVRVYNLDDPVVDMTRESGSFDWNFDYDESDQVGGEEEEEGKVVMAMSDKYLCEEEMRRKICLTLDYEAVITAWASQGSPWTTGNRPELNPDDCWPSLMGGVPTNVPHDPSGAQVGGGGDARREARVSRYREKRRTRLFSKKIRYEVRKLNAEKRPRLKGRFVKRTSFVGAAFPYLN